MKRRILIVDDERDVCEMVKLNPERTRHYEVLYAADGHGGIEPARDNRPDLYSSTSGCRR